MAGLIREGGTYTNLTASGPVSKVPGTVLGFYVNSTNAGTIVFTDSATSTGGTAITGTITPAIGWHRLPVQCLSGCYVTIGGSALNVTVIFAAG